MSNPPSTIHNRELRQFGILVGTIFVGLFGLLLPLLRGHSLPIWPFVVGTPLLVLGLFVPGALRPIYVGWMKVGAVLGWINTRIILGTIFFLMVTPMGVVMRLVGRDPMTRRRDPKAKSYRHVSATRPISHMKDPY